MREILFKGIRKDTGEWVEGYYVCLGEHHYILTGKLDLTMGYPVYIQYDVIPETVGQYTGLTGKNGKRIFEGDIFRFDDEVWSSSYTSCGTEYDSWEVENYGVVGFDEDTARFDFIKYKYNENSVEADLHENNCLEFSEFVKELEVIGNIHDNPELMGGNENE